jgi:hypothetical protein
VSAERDELIRLAREIPEDQVRPVLAELRKHLRSAGTRRWPPAFFASAPGEPDTSERIDEYLREGFGR